MYVVLKLMNKNNKLPFSFSNSSALILNSFNQVNNAKSFTSPVDNFLKVSSFPEKAEHRSSLSENLKFQRTSKKITFKELHDPLDKPIPSFNTDNKQKLAHLKLNNRNLKGILKKNPKYLIPDDIITEQIIKYEREFSLKNDRVQESNQNNQNLDDQDKKLLIESFYFSSDSPENNHKEKIKENNNQNEDLTKKQLLDNEKNEKKNETFGYNLIEYDYKKNESLSPKKVESFKFPSEKEKENEEHKKPNFFKPPKNNVFASVVSSILIDNPFAKLKNKSFTDENESPQNESKRIPYYQEKTESDNENFVLPQLNEKSKKTTTETEESSILFNYDKKQNLKKTKLQTDWNFIQEDVELKRIEETKKVILSNISKLGSVDIIKVSTEKSETKETINEESPNNKKIDDKEISSKLKEIEAKSTPILKEWPEKVNYNFSLNVSKDEKSHLKAKDDLNNLSTLTSNKMERKEPNIDLDSKVQISKLRFFLANYFIAMDTRRKNELIFSMMNKIIIKHDLNKNLWSYYQLEENLLRTEFFAICSYNNMLIISGGIDPIYGEITKNTFIFNYDDKTLVQKSAMKISRYKHLLIIISSVIYCIGGCSKGEIGIKNCEKYLIEEDKWVNMASLKMKRNFLRGVCSVCNNSIYVLGGNDYDNHLILVIEKYDILHDVWGLINFSNEIIISNACKLLLLNKKGYSDKVLDDILILDKKNSENGPEFKTSLIDLENGIIEEDLEFKLNPENFILLHQDSFYIFPLDSYERSDKLSLKTSFVENINFEYYS